MNSAHRRRITVGYDGSAQAGAAVRWATCEAFHGGDDIQVLTCVADAPGADQCDRLLPDPRPVYEMAEWLMQAQHDSDVQSSSEFHWTVAPGRVEQRVIAESQRSDLLVIGSKGHVVLGDWRLGAVAHEIVQHTTCPLVLVPEHHLPAANGRVVVGIEDETSHAAVAWAASEAARRNGELVIVHCRSTEGDDGVVSPDAATALLNEAASVAAESGRAPVTTRLVAGSPTASLLALSVDGDLLVVGARESGRGHERPGSIAHAVGARATVPIVIVPPGDVAVDQEDIHPWRRANQGRSD